MFRTFLLNILVTLLVVGWISACSTGEPLGGVDEVAENIEPDDNAGDGSNDDGFSADQLAAGKEIYEAQCLACHGEKGDGQTPLFVIDIEFEAIQDTVVDTMPFGATNDCIEQCAEDVSAYLTDMYVSLYSDSGDDDSGDDDSGDDDSGDDDSGDDGSGDDDSGDGQTDCDYPQWVSGTAYQAGDSVFNRNEVFVCLVAGWCSNSADWAYEPGSGLYWSEAWQSEGACDSDEDDDSSKIPEAVSTVISVASASLDRIGTSWTDNSSNETGFKIERKVNDGVWEAIGELGQNANQYDDLDVDSGSAFTYRVIAFNGSGEADATAGNPVELFESETVPEMPTELQVNANEASISLTWSDNASNESSYKVQRKTTDSEWTDLVTLAVNSESYLDESVVVGTSYYYRVYALNNVGNSDFSNTAIVELVNNDASGQLFSQACSGCHKAGGTGGDLFDGFVEQSWVENSFDEFFAKVSSMPVSNCDDSCLRSIAEYIWVDRWDYSIDEQEQVGDDRGVRGIRLLTPYEYKNSVKDITGVSIADKDLPANFFESDFKYPTQAEKGIVLYDQVLEYFNLANDIAEQTNLAALGCSTTDCSEDTIRSIGQSIFRRPLTEQEFNAYQNLSDEYNPQDMLASMLMSPNFLYRVELGGWSNEHQAYKLNSYEVATQLSFQLWGTTPSADLLSLAQDEGLNSASEIEAQAEQMVNDTRFANHFVEFIRYYTKTYGVADEKPALSATVIQAMKDEQDAFVKYVINSGDASLSELFNPGYTFVNSILADHYDLNVFASNSMTRANTDSNRGGLLHHGITQILNSDFAATSLVKRGKMIRENIMCHIMGVPSGVDPGTIEIPQEPITTRDRWNIITGPEASEGQCWACHQLMNEPGSALENFDQTGKFRLQETAYNDESTWLNINAAGVLRNNDSSANAEYSGARELAQLLGSNSQVKSCFAESLYQFHFGYHADALTESGLFQVQQSFVQNDNIKSLIKQLLMLESSLYRVDRE